MKPVFRYLRIAFSATCLIVCVLLIVLWLRSYWRDDSVSYCNASVWIGVDSKRGLGGLLWTKMDQPPPADLAGWRVRSLPLRVDNPYVKFPRWHWDKQSGIIWIPIGLLVLASTALAAVPWLRWRFSLRTLLIAMTLVAVVLGLAVWLIRK
jgi:hypothetical protein